MNVGQFLSALSVAGDAPERIQQLRKIAVALAVNGRLGPLASRPKELPTVSEDELPAEFNDATHFTRVGAIAHIEKGKTGIKQAVAGPFALVVTGQERASCDHCDFDGAAAIVPLVSSAGHGKASINRLHYQEGKFALGTILAAVLPRDSGTISARFIFEYLSAFKDELLVSKMIGTANVSLSVGKIADVPIPLVSPAAQQRLDELMALCDRLEAARAQREATRDRLTAATLARLNTPKPTASPFQADARFALDVLSAITTRPDQLKQLRQTILNLAIQGKLVPHDAREEPASKLLETIAAEKAAHKLRTKDARIKDEPDPLPASLPIELPAGWAAQSFENLFLFVDYRGNTPPKTDSGIPLITAKNIRMGHLNREPREFISEQTYATWMTRGFPAIGDLFFTTEAPLANVCLNDIDEPFALAQRVICLQPYGMINTKFVMFALMSDAMQSLIDRNATGMTAKGIKAANLKPLPIPVPPLAEQHRIVAKIDELMAFFDQLEASLTRGESTRSRLLDALLHEALQPSHDNVVDFHAAQMRLIEKRQAIGCRIVERLSRTKGFGRTRAVKPFYWAEAHCGIALGGRWGRGNFGPYDQWITSFEADAVSAGWFSCTKHPTSDGSSWIEYKPGPQLTTKAKMAARALDQQAAEFERVLTLLAGLDTEKTEIVTTLFAAWNDLLIEGKPVSDRIVITEMREHWHPSKSRFTSAQLQPWLDWLRQNDLVPKGLGPCTRHQTELL